MSSLDEFREETRQWLADNAPKSLYQTRRGAFDGFWGGRKCTEGTADQRRWLEASLTRGWTAPMWPTEYGGGGLSRPQAEVLVEELEALGLPPPLVGFGLVMIGPTLLDYGTVAQQEAFLPPTLRGEIRWCQGYSEPGAGSDLASLQTRGVVDGDAMVINGQKVWTSHADKCDWIFCLVRTSSAGKKQEGITFVLIDMETPGVSVRPIELISGASPFCEVFLEDVRVPMANVVGEVDKGWTVAKALLGYERSVIGLAIGSQLEGAEGRLVELARRHLDEPEGGLRDAYLRHGIAELGMDEQCFGLTLSRIQQARESGKAPGPESSIVKIAGSELKQRRFELTMRIAGPQAAGWEGPGFEADDLQATRDWLRSRGNSIEGGTTEIQLNIIARRVLGLP